MLSLLPSEQLQLVEKEFPGRLAQIHQLALYYNVSSYLSGVTSLLTVRQQYLPPPPILVAHGLEGTHKLETIASLLRSVNFQHVVVKSSECLSQRHLLSKIFSSCIRRLGQQDDVEKFHRVDGINALMVNLQKLFGIQKERFVLVIDGIDRQRGAAHTLLPSLARLGDIIPALSIILTTSSPRPLPLHRSGVSYVHFPPYTRNEAIQLVIGSPPPLQPESLPNEFPSIGTLTLSSIYASFVAAIYDTLITHTSSTSIPTFRRSCERLWPRFIWPLLSNEAIPNRNQFSKTSTTWDFARLIIRNKALFQLQGEKTLTPRLQPDAEEVWTFTDLHRQYEEKQSHAVADNAPRKAPPAATGTTPLLKFFPTLLLLSAYLASHTPPKHDIILFSRLSSSSSHKRKYLSSALNKNRVRKTPTKTKASSSKSNGGGPDTDLDGTPSKKRNKALSASEMTVAAKEKTHKSTRLQFEKTSSIPKPFPLERVVAIFRAVHPDALSRTRGVADRIYAEMVELERLRMVVRLGTGANAGASSVSANAVSGGGAVGTAVANESGGGTSSKGTDEGVLEEKWRVNVGREVVVQLGKRWGISIEGWEID